MSVITLNAGLIRAVKLEEEPAYYVAQVGIHTLCAGDRLSDNLKLSYILSTFSASTLANFHLFLGLKLCNYMVITEKWFF